MNPTFAYQPTSTAATILCCECGVPMPPNSANMCLSCIRTRVDVTEGLPRQLSAVFCRGYERFLQPPAQWLPAALESKELLALLLRKIKGLNKLRLVDAKFIWTEPHSRRIKMLITVQKEVFAATVLQQTFEVETIMVNQQCPDCAKVEAKNTWTAACQVRQKVPHKRTFLYLEQLILKHSAHKDCVSIKGRPDGLDFFFSNRQNALKFQDFLQCVIPVRSKSSEQLISSDIHSSSSTYKFTYSIEIVPICRDDLVVLPRVIAQQLGNISPLVLCHKVTTNVHFIDPNTLQTAELPSSVYWNVPFRSVMNQKQLVEYYVVDVEPSGRNQGSGKHLLADVQVTRCGESGALNSSGILFARSHLGNILKPGDICLGYDLTVANLNSDEMTDFMQRHELPDVVLVKKSYRHLRRPKHQQRAWKLKSLDMEVDEDDGKGEDVEMRAREYEQFLQDLEEDKDLRETVNIYKDSQHACNAMVIESDDGGDEGVPNVPIEELLEELSLN